MSDNLLIQALLITLVAFIGYMHCYWGLTMNNRPIVVAALVALVIAVLGFFSNSKKQKEAYVDDNEF